MLPARHFLLCLRIATAAATTETTGTVAFSFSRPGCATPGAVPCRSYHLGPLARRQLAGTQETRWGASFSAWRTDVAVISIDHRQSCPNFRRVGDRGVTSHDTGFTPKQLGDRLLQQSVCTGTASHSLRTARNGEPIMRAAAQPWRNGLKHIGGREMPIGTLCRGGPDGAPSRGATCLDPRSCGPWVGPRWIARNAARRRRNAREAALPASGCQPAAVRSGSLRRQGGGAVRAVCRVTSGYRPKR